MLPPVRLKTRSRSRGVSTCRSMTARLKFGAYPSSRSKQRSANASPRSSQEPSRSSYGAYWTNIDIRCLPGGATVGSTVEPRLRPRQCREARQLAQGHVDLQRGAGVAASLDVRHERLGQRVRVEQAEKGHVRIGVAGDDRRMELVAV